ncbi:MAG TPA: hypothetical protein PLW49_01650 [bacterium]|nr:hypothetical protein [bacterium]
MKEDSSVKNNLPLKKVLLFSLFTLEMALLSKVILNFVYTQKYFSLSPDFAIPFLILLIVILWTINLIVITTHQKPETFILPVLFFIFAFFLLNQSKIIESLLLSLIFSLYFLYKITRTKKFEENLLKVKTSYSGRYASKGFLLALNGIIAIKVLFTSENANLPDIEKWAVDTTENQIEKIEEEYKNENPRSQETLDLSSLEKTNPELSAVLKSLGITDSSILKLSEETSYTSTEEIDKSITKNLSNSLYLQIDKILEPYKKYFRPALAVLVFGLLQIYGAIAYFIYSITIDLILRLLLKFKIIGIEKIQTEKEIFKI